MYGFKKILRSYGQISATKPDLLSLLRTLRSETGLGVARCKAALEQTNFSYDEAKRLLMEGASCAINSTSNSKSISEGLVGYVRSEKAIAIFKLICQTDFVSKSDYFHEVAQDVAKVLADQMNPLSETLQSNPQLDRLINVARVKCGEPIRLGSLVSFPLDNLSAHGIYVHQAKASGFGSLAAFVSLSGTKSDPEVDKIAQQAAMHLAGCEKDLDGLIIQPNDDISSEPHAHFNDRAKSNNLSSILARPFLFDEGITFGEALGKAGGRIRHLYRTSLK